MRRIVGVCSIQHTSAADCSLVETTVSANASSSRAESTAGSFEILIDGLCPLCKREARFLEWLDKGRGRLVLTDITDPGFDPASYGTTMDEVMGSIHARNADGTMVTGMEVFRIAYSRVGWGWFMGWTGWPVFRPLVDAGYRWFAKHRLRLTGHADRCPDGRCKVG